MQLFTFVALAVSRLVGTIINCLTFSLCRSTCCRLLNGIEQSSIPFATCSMSNGLFQHATSHDKLDNFVEQPVQHLLFNNVELCSIGRFYTIGFIIRLDLGKHSLFVWLCACVSSIKTGTRSIMRLDVFFFQ